LRKTILVVDDDDLVRTVTVRMLRRLGYEVIETSNAETAIDAAKAHAGTIHLVLSDIVLGAGNGIEVLQTISVVRPDAASLLMSGSGVSVAEGVRFLQKPFTYEQLRDRVFELIGPVDAL